MHYFTVNLIALYLVSQGSILLIFTKERLVLTNFNFDFSIQWGLEYRTHLNTKNFEVQISNDLVLEWLVIVIAIAMGMTFSKPKHWKSVQNGHPLFKMEHHWKTKCHWKTDLRATIGILNSFSIPARTVIV